MNEKIKQLAEQATNDVKDEFDHWINSEFNKEKFAELIVLECAGIVENQGQFLRYDVLAKKIKENFEIKK